MLLITDAEKRLFLCGACCRGWTPPELPFEGSVTCYDAARAFVAVTFGEVAFRFGDMRGRQWALPRTSWERERRLELTVLIVRLEASQPGRLDRHPIGQHVWWGLGDLQRQRRFISPPGIVTLIDGYFDGWLPDGDLPLE